MTCPADRTRKSASLFYWAPNKEAIEQGSFITFLPGTRGTKARAFVRSLIPPAAFTLRDTVRSKLRRGG